MSNLCQIFVKSLSILFLSPFPVNVSYFNDLSNFCQIFFKSLSNICQFFFPLRFLWMFLISMIYQIFVKSFSNLCQIFVKSLSNLNPFPVNVTSWHDFLKHSPPTIRRRKTSKLRSICKHSDHPALVQYGPQKVFMFISTHNWSH